MALTDDQLAAWRAFFEAQAILIPALEQELVRECGLTLSWYEVLLHLAEAPDRQLRMGALASSTLLSKSGLTKTVDGMEQARLVQRRPSGSDRRVVHVVLTDAGLALLRRAWSTHRRGIEERFSRHLGDTEARMLVRVLSRVRAAGDSGATTS